MYIFIYVGILPAIFYLPFIFFSCLIGVLSNWVRVWNSSSPITCLGYPCIILIAAVTQYSHLHLRIIDSVWSL